MRKRLMVLFLTSTFLIPNISVFADETTENNTETTTEATTSTIDSIQNTMNEMSNSYDTSSVSGGKNKGNHGGTTMTLSEYQSLIESNSTDFKQLDNDTMFNVMKNSLDAGEDINLGDAFTQSSGLDIPSNFMYDLSDCGIDGKLDASEINLEYANLLSNMDKEYSNNAEDLSDNALDATKLFSNTYGDLAEKLQIDEATLPEDFSLSAITKQNTDTINSAYNSALNSSEYSSVKSKVNSSDIFEKASQGLSMPSLMSPSDLSALTSDYNSQLENKWNAKSNESKAACDDLYNKNKSATDSKYADEISNINAKREENDNKKQETEDKIGQERNKAEATKGNGIGKMLDEWGWYKWVDNIDYQEKAEKRAEKKRKKAEKKAEKERKKAEKKAEKEKKKQENKK